MAVNFNSLTWYEEIGVITQEAEYQTCAIVVQDFSDVVTEYNYATGEMTTTGAIELYAGQARFIPVRSSVWQGGEAQLNTTSIRAVRFQLPMEEKDTRIYSGAIVKILTAPGNPNLQGRTAKVNDDFIGASAATRTFHATMDADSEDI